MFIVIIVFSILIAVGMVVAILHLLFNKYLIANDSGKIMFEIDYGNRKIRNVVHPSLSGNRLPSSQKIHKFYNGHWIPLREFTSIFDEYTNKRIRNALHELENGPEEKISFPVFMIKNGNFKNARKKDKKGKEFNMNATLFRCENKSGYQLIAGEIKFNLPMQEDRNIFPDRISKDKIYQFDEKFVGLWVFNLREVTSMQKDNFFNEIKKVIGINNIHYFLYENKLCIVIPTQSILLTDRRLLKKEGKLKKELHRKGMHEYYDFSGIILTTRISSPKKNKEALIKLDYLICKSRKMNAKSKYLQEDIQEFQKFKEAYIIVEQSIKAKSMTTGTTRVKKYDERHEKKGRALINYLFPDIEGISPRYFTMVLSNPNIRKKMMDAHADKIMESKNTKPSILDVNAEWLIRQTGKTINNKIIYMVEYSSETQHKLLFATIKQFQEKKILCGIRIKQTDIKYITTITRVAPKFIVIDREVSKQAHKPDTYVKLAAIRKAAKKTHIIYELPSHKIDEKQKEVIGLNFYYDYK